MNRHNILILAGCLAVCLGILATLYAFSPLSKKIHRASFDRMFFRGIALTENAAMDIEYNSFYIAGATQSNVYLGNSTAPFHLLIANTHLTDSQHVMLNVRLDSIKDPRRFRLTVDSPYFFMAHGTMPELLRGNVGEWKADRFIPSNGDYFVDAVPMSPSSFAFRSYSISSKGYELARKNKEDPFYFNYDLLQKQVDGLFCVDGLLHYSKELNELVYLHYYRNEFIVADTNLTLRYRGHTIDTFSRARIKVSKIGSGNESMLSAPPIQINGRSCVSGRYLFVHSNLLARNESIQDFLEKTVIDMYDLTDGRYIHSFYIPQYRHQKASDFKVFGKQLAAIYDQYLVTYDLSDDLFELNRPSL